LRTRAAQLLKIAIKPFDNVARVGNKLALLIGYSGVHAESSLAQIRRFRREVLGAE
jgi:hypothetical protein